MAVGLGTATLTVSLAAVILQTSSLPGGFNPQVVSAAAQADANRYVFNDMAVGHDRTISLSQHDL